MELLDNAADRIQDRFVASVEAVRVGTVTAHDKKALGKWTRSKDQRGTKSAALKPQQLEAAIMRIGDIFPGHVIREAA